MTNKYQNAVLDDQALIDGLKAINPVWGDLTVRVAGEVWGQPLLDQKTKALITIAIDQMALNVTGEGNPFGAHVDMALKQGATYQEIEELIVFASAYTGFNKGATTMGALNKIRHERGDI
ncbi:carboxymuconolactone decarboxylase family protein [Photobacterium sp. BZF1]|uniref:Carboxymuconolactone decarboxylase family protein n=1 Tax=Photobacterium rosenbergii TaxID=294936 RepID=A0A2T3NL66_9GAMM|nr:MULTISPECIES: carboxymuconolactone decarboxylase family protein [Photobacterium]MBC7002996.1 carboxymuconolactone decarboxylase family protein [Photobacterium sp. BZF1]MBY5948910.1 carboxymuconolactone decarboxylase family protein [Photobacterium rosenbergii]PSW16265.1 carboxymuconolactone decarboxylase family protein [Photobacterium rosenbergii]